MFSETLIALAQNLITTCTERGIMIATAESCTGGLVAALLTEISGSSAVVDRGFVTYSNQAKESLLGVPAILIENYGAVSREVAIAMAEGAFKHSDAELTLAITGIAGPGGGTAAKPVGLVYIACNYNGMVYVDEMHFSGSRAQVRLSAVEHALNLALSKLSRN